ncbi:MAG: hypothetical protein EHM70_19385 [Chloroflexota bacterium]|nr:MAG: hypothetical protein EHM70_19385 [Chloroflexota bacterium]
MATPVPLLETKLRIPPEAPVLITRPHLIEKLNEGLRLGRRATLISAPAGYGKTTLLSSWAHQCRRPVAWLSLDEDDSDPARFLAYLVASLGKIDMVSGSLAGIASLQPFSTQAAVPALIHEIETAGREFVLMLDDYHLIQASPVHHALTYLLDHQPSNLHLVIATRADPPLPFARLRARGQLNELRQIDLRFTLDETTSFLNQAMKLGLDAGDVSLLASRTEGWIAGLRLAATSLQAHGETHRFIQNFRGSNRYVLDYLIEEVIQRQPANVQAFLLQTSILDRLSSPLCEAVVGQAGGQAMLETLERANLFIVPLDDERRWYRYHRLFADLLQKRLTETYPELVPALHNRASEWHEQNGLLAEAIDHALAAGQLQSGSDDKFERAAQLIENIAETMLMRSEAITLLKWINALPEEHVRSRPCLSVYHACVLFLGGSSLDAIEARLKYVEGDSTPLTLPLMAFAAYFRNDLTRSIELSQRALAQLPAKEMFLRGLATWNLVNALHTSGDLMASQRVLQEATQAGYQPGNALLMVIAVCYRAEINRREGKLHRARLLFQQALDMATDKSGARLPIANQALVGLGEIAREWNELDLATQYVLEAIDLAGRWAQSGPLDAYMALALIRQAQEDWDGVHEILQKMRLLAIEFKVTDADDRLVDMVEAWMQISEGSLDGPRQWAERYGMSGPFDPSVLEQGDQATIRRFRKYEYPITARLWIADGRPADALALLEAVLPGVEEINRIGLAIEYEILIAIAAHALGQENKSLRAIERALTLAEPEGYVRIFLDVGKALAGILSMAISNRIRPGYARRLLAAIPNASPAAVKPAGMVEQLSGRELEVLGLIAEGLSNEEIAQRLVLSLPTIKWHTSNIYGKLIVKNRTEAVARARILGLLPLS